MPYSCRNTQKPPPKTAEPTLEPACLPMGQRNKWAPRTLPLAARHRFLGSRASAPQG